MQVGEILLFISKILDLLLYTIKIIITFAIRSAKIVMKKGGIMCVIKDVTRFIANGAKVLRDSSRGEYKQESEIISQLKKELFIESDKMDDKSKLRQDRKNIEKDVRDAWEKLKLSNG